MSIAYPALDSFLDSVDMNMDKYVIKNFEAIPCGCLLFAYDQGTNENRVLCFVDMQNIVL
jgi:hypothetical protein